LNIVEQVIVHAEPMFESHVSSNIPIKLVSILHVKIIIPFDTFQQHLPETFLKPEVGKMEINETLV
jgi:hypothetical protein